MMKLERLAFLLGSMLLVTGCATTGDDSSGDAGTGDATADERSGAQAGGLRDDEMLTMDPLEDPDSALSERIIYFEFDRSDIPQKYLDLLGEHAEYLIANPGMKVRLEGHADERGSREYNIGLGDRRAQAVRRILLFQGVANDQVSTVSYGEERPAVDDSTESAYERNRRVELVYLR
jgi:peptidoglycan-associated lipoprotein